MVANVRGEAFWAAEELLDPCPLQCRQARHGPVKNRLEVIEAAGDFIEAEVFRDAVRTPGPGFGLEGADQQLARIVLVIGAGVVIPHDRKARVQAFDGFEQGIVVLAGVQRHVDADGGRQVAGPHACAEDDAIGIDFTMRGGNAGYAAFGGADGGYRHVLDNAHPGAARALGERLGDVHRVGVAVRRNMDAAEHVAGVQQRHPFLDRLRCQHLHFQTEHLGHGGAALEFLEPLLVGRQRDRSAPAITRRLASLGFEPVVQLPRVAGEMGHVDRRSQLTDQSGGVPSGAGRELLPFEQQNAGAVGTAEMVGDGAADDTAADDNHLRPMRERGRLSLSVCHCSATQCPMP